MCVSMWLGCVLCVLAACGCELFQLNYNCITQPGLFSRTPTPRTLPNHTHTHTHHHHHHHHHQQQQQQQQHTTTTTPQQHTTTHNNTQQQHTTHNNNNNNNNTIWGGSVLTSAGELKHARKKGAQPNPSYPALCRSSDHRDSPVAVYKVIDALLCRPCEFHKSSSSLSRRRGRSPWSR